ASALPRGTDRETTARTDAMQRALIAATDVPLGVARAATEVATLLGAVARIGNPHVRSDAALGALLADAALRGALLNVRGNATQIRDRERAAAYLEKADRLEAAGRAAARRAYHSATGVANERGSH
ncbi:MAG: cyclodeaminase/cyclohydrolase family protein, partial [Thermomicrobiales bacterium]